MKPVRRVIAIGSPHGDDQVAWQLIERLRSRRGIDASLVALSAPSRLHDYIEDCQQLIIVDACAGSGWPGKITRLAWPDARIEQRHSHSTHGMGVADALQLAEKLGRLPAKVVVFGIELSQCQTGAAPSGTVERALGQLEERILHELQ
jgi:hydrogenase maturation protease